MKTPSLHLPLALLLGACSILPLQAQTPLLSYNFNGASSSTAANAGTASGADLTYHNASNQVVNLYSPAGSGVSGSNGDTALNNTSAAGMGTIGNSPAGASTTTKSVSLGTLSSFTIAGWYNAETTPGSGGKLFELFGDQSIALIAEGNNRLALNIFGSSSGNNSSPLPAYSVTGSWVFFAVTYDGTASTNNLSFYIGDANSVSAAGSRSITGSSIAFGMTGVGVGNGYYNGGAANRPFDGLVDNVAFYGAGDNTGVLTLAQLDALRLSTIPEPSGAATLAGLAGITVMMFKRRRRNS